MINCKLHIIMQLKFDVVVCCTFLVLLFCCSCYYYYCLGWANLAGQNQAKTNSKRKIVYIKKTRKNSHI